MAKLLASLEISEESSTTPSSAKTGGVTPASATGVQPPSGITPAAKAAGECATTNTTTNTRTNTRGGAIDVSQGRVVERSTAPMAPPAEARARLEHADADAIDGYTYGGSSGGSQVSLSGMLGGE